MGLCYAGLVSRKKVTGVTMTTEDKIILDITREYLQNETETAATFAVNKLFPELDRAGIQLAKTENTAEDVYKNLANAKVLIGRVFKGTKHFPLNWKWSWISCLPSPYQDRCIHELNSLTMTTVPSVKGEHVMADMGLLSKEFGEAVLAVAPLMADGIYDHNDNPEDVKKALNELYDLRDATQAQINAIESATGHRVKRSVRGIRIKQETTITTL